jgi:nucleoside-diphosphate-sugar epimerase
LAYAKNYDLRVRIARLHNVFGPESHYDGGREKSPAALCRKVITSTTGEVEIWGPGTQTRSFLYIDECVEGIIRIMKSEYQYPVNLGSEFMITINDLALLIAKAANKIIHIKNIPGPVGVMGRSSHNQLIKKEIGWRPDENLELGIEKTYYWIEKQINDG